MLYEQYAKALDVRNTGNACLPLSTRFKSGQVVLRHNSEEKRVYGTYLTPYSKIQS